jgi:transposase
MEITAVGLDIAKSVFQVHAADGHGKVVARKKLKRAQVLEYFATLPPCLVGMEACGGAHYWARKLQELGHTVRLIPPQYVKAYVKTNKNDAIDAEAIWEALTRPNMRFAAIKSVEQQALLALHRARSGLMKSRVAQANQIRGLLAEFGIVVPQGIRKVFSEVPWLIDEKAENELPLQVRTLMQRLLEHLKELDGQVQELEQQIQLWHRQSPASRRIEAIPGIGVLSASAFVATLGDASSFQDGRQVSAWMGIVPRQRSSGGKQQLLGISKHGDSYLRTLFIHGARSVVKSAMRQQSAADPRLRWVVELVKRRGVNVAAVALANKNARTAWALLAHDREFRADYAGA